MQVQEHLVPLDVAIKLALSLGVGLFAGFEREWSRKDIGVRAFALTALLGTLSSLISLEFSLVSLGAVTLLRVAHLDCPVLSDYFTVRVVVRIGTKRGVPSCPRCLAVSCW